MCFSFQPHANFRTINAAFSTSRFTPRLLSALQLSNDTCMLRCAISELCYKPRNPLTSEPYEVPPNLKGIFSPYYLIKWYEILKYNISVF